MKKITALIPVFLFGFSLFFTSLSLASDNDWTNINGTVSYNGSPVCAMVLANGQYMFTSSEDGAFSIDVPLDEYGQITVFTFCSGLAPFQKVVYPAEGHGMMVDLQESNQGQGMNVTCGLQPINTDWVRLAGIATYNGTPLCAMILANGQYMFTSQANGYYTLDVPMDDFGNIRYCQFFCVKFFSANSLKKGRFLATLPIGFDLQ